MRSKIRSLPTHVSLLAADLAHLLLAVFQSGTARVRRKACDAVVIATATLVIGAATLVTAGWLRGQLQPLWR